MLVLPPCSKNEIGIVTGGSFACSKFCNYVVQSAGQAVAEGAPAAFAPA
jgi:hypothetical protein